MLGRRLIAQYFLKVCFISPSRPSGFAFDASSRSSTSLKSDSTAGFASVCTTWHCSQK